MSEYAAIVDKILGITASAIKRGKIANMVEAISDEECKAEWIRVLGPGGDILAAQWLRNQITQGAGVGSGNNDAGTPE